MSDVHEKRAGCGTWLGILVAIAFAAPNAGCGPRVPDRPIAIDPELVLPLQENSVRLAIIGDSGTGGSGQYAVAQTMTRFHDVFPFELVLMLGDNLYGSEDPEDYEEKFEEPYRKLLERGVRFYASLGNHDDLSQRLYAKFNMKDESPYYSFRPEGHDNVRFFSIYSDYLDPEQLDWLQEALSENDEKWKICFFHHPIYSSGGRHGPDLALRKQLEPLFVKHGVDVVFAGHEHFYERIEPQKGIAYFISGAAGKLRRGNIRESDITAKGFDGGRHFLLVEISGDSLYFQAISRNGESVDAGSFRESGRSYAPIEADK